MKTNEDITDLEIRLYELEAILHALDRKVEALEQKDKLLDEYLVKLIAVLNHNTDELYSRVETLEKKQVGGSNRIGGVSERVYTPEEITRYGGPES